MNRRIARKIVKALLYPSNWSEVKKTIGRYSVDQARRAALRVFERPIVVVADADSPWTSQSAEWCRRGFGRGRALLLTDRLAVFETRRGLWEVRRRHGRIQIEYRTLAPQPLFGDEVTTPVR